MIGDVLQFCNCMIAIHASCGLTGWSACQSVSASATVPKLTWDNVYVVSAWYRAQNTDMTTVISLFLFTFRESTGSGDDTITHLPSQFPIQSSVNKFQKQHVKHSWRGCQLLSTPWKYVRTDFPACSLWQRQPCAYPSLLPLLLTDRAQVLLWRPMCALKNYISGLPPGREDQSCENR